MSATPRLRRLRGRFALAGIVALSALLTLSARAAADTSAATTLADRYSPAIELQPQGKLCGSGEAYRPTTVDILLGNPEVVLRNSAGKVVKRGPTAQDLSGAAGDYIDLGGNALRPGCFYEKQFKRWFGDRKPTVYAHIATDSAHPGKLAVQYWFFYTFNDFTNKHEGDWEMAQVDFDAATPEQALGTGPYEVDLAQHAGGERGAWDEDRKLTKDGTHPVEYLATGSHAGYFQSNLYLGKGGSAIFGCEDTRRASERVSLQTVVLPDTPVPPDSSFAWLNFAGRWGQKQPGIHNGPFGPSSGDDREEWTHPLTWSEGLRTSSLTVPGGRVLGLSVTSFFCGAVDRAAVAMNWGLIHPAPFFALLGLVVVAGAGTARRTRWRPPDPRPIRHPRGGGQIVRAAGRLYWANPWTFIGIGAVFIPVSVVAAAIQWVLFHLTGLSGFVSLDGRTGVGTDVLALFIGDVGGVFAAAVVTGAVSAALNELDGGRPVNALGAYSLAARNALSLGGATMVQFGLILLLVLSVVGIPLAVYYFIRTSLFAQTCVLEDQSAIGCLRASAALTRRHWWRTFGFTALIDVIAILAGPLLGVLILLLTARSLTFIDISGSIVYALVVPYAAIALTLYYFDLQAKR